METDIYNLEVIGVDKTSTPGRNILTLKFKNKQITVSTPTEGDPTEEDQALLTQAYRYLGLTLLHDLRTFFALVSAVSTRNLVPNLHMLLTSHILVSLVLKNTRTMSLVTSIENVSWNVVIGKRASLRTAWW